MHSSFFSNAVAQNRFNIGSLTQQFLSAQAEGSVWIQASRALEQALGQAAASKIIARVIRAVFLIEPVNESITSTKFAVRWVSEPNAFFNFKNQNDPRWCGYDECMAIAEGLLNELLNKTSDIAAMELLKLCVSDGLVPHEIPIDYEQDNIAAHPSTRLHCLENVKWQWGNNALKPIKLRSFLKRQPQPLGEILTKILNNKVSIKTYLTDRAQTGLHQTNREKRWESHPLSVQFASRRIAWGVEYELVTQLCYFEGFPEEVRNDAIQNQLIEQRGEVSKCPITLEPLSFVKLSEEVTNPTHGKSEFQVGHLNPLKAVGRENPEAGHTSHNIAWISLDGNRIQGHLSLEDTRKLIARIAANYAKLAS